MSRSIRLAIAVILVVAALSTGTTVSFAHANYVSSTPPANATLTAAPASLAITFSEELSSIQITVTGPHGAEVTTSRASIDLAQRTNTSVPLRDDGAGQYTVVWRNVSEDDGDPNDGSFSFVVVGVAQSAQAAVTPTPPPGQTTGAAAPSPTADAVACVERGTVTPGISDTRLNTYCKRQAVRDQYKGKIDETLSISR